MSPQRPQNGRGMAKTPSLSRLVGPPGHRAEFLPSLWSYFVIRTAELESSVVRVLSRRQRSRYALSDRVGVFSASRATYLAR